MDIPKLKAAINRLETIDNKTKSLIENATEAHFEKEVRPMKKDWVFPLYRTRYYLITSKGKHNQNWINLLDKMDPLEDDALIIITLLVINEKSYIIFSDDNYEKCFGIIYT